MGLCAAAFIAVLLTARLDEIAHFAVLSPSPGLAAMFIILQIPYILPIVIPISCLISSILLVQKLSKSHELTAFRACGISLKDFLTPILFSSALVAVVNFYIISELATYSHYQTFVWKEELRSTNPLHLLRNKHLMRIKGGFFDTLGDSRLGKNAGEVVLALPNNNQSRITLFLAKELASDDDLFAGTDVTVITTASASEPDSFDHLLIENSAETEAMNDDFSKLMKRKPWKINNDYFTMEQLLARLNEEKTHGSSASSVICCYTEIFRRISLGFAAFTFTLLGLSFGISINRTRSIRNVLWVVLLAGLYIAAFFLAKGAENKITLSLALYAVPHLLIIFFSGIVLFRVSHGIEGG